MKRSSVKWETLCPSRSMSITLNMSFPCQACYWCAIDDKLFLCTQIQGLSWPKLPESVEIIRISVSADSGVNNWSTLQWNESILQNSRLVWFRLQRPVFFRVELIELYSFYFCLILAEISHMPGLNKIIQLFPNFDCAIVEHMWTWNSLLIHVCVTRLRWVKCRMRSSIYALAIIEVLTGKILIFADLVWKRAMTNLTTH